MTIARRAFRRLLRGDVLSPALRQLLTGWMHDRKAGLVAPLLA
ncbi:MAG TPA: hypothetical protein VMB84_00025 [Stellaceae bacterium]|nr:hypothetical protein [Stellaceae bacterium]